ncbi:LysR family transcriptional regulator [Motilimonas sp. E26]|uniref:LysR family transcriptional regulator n=1 Tax=Motilimonas sp. E26 TaxID=2865674 RepID=UPI001E62DCAA|nr:LysR family transcriptional regulator [Motilimonas sp. E26]MCE0555575.1 LysR family transcriptional regulator [Motilimonas sp. E26]
MKTEDIALFHRIVETGSLVEAADILNLPKSTLSRRLQALEDELNVKLFHRQSRAMSLTASGSHFYSKTTPLLAALEQTRTELTGHKSDVSGHLRILIVPVPEQLWITRVIFDFMDQNPELSVELIVSAEPQNMIRNNIDLAFLLEDTFNETEMVARHICDEKIHFYASPDYIKNSPVPISLEELPNHNSILFRYPNGRVFNNFPIGEDKVLTLKGNLCVNNLEAILEATLTGRGISMMPRPYVQEFIDNGQLIMLFEEIGPFEGKCYLVYPSRRFISLASQRFIDFMMNTLEQHKQSNAGNIGIAAHGLIHR